MKVYVVLEEDRGLGVSVVGVYRNFEDAERVADTSSHAIMLASTVADIEEELQ